MRHKVADLEGKNLDAAVNVAEWKRKTGGRWVGEPRAYSTEWKHGGPIIERESIEVTLAERGGWFACIPRAESFHVGGFGPTPLVAAMRAYSASVFGDEVELPDADAE